ncbi:MAG TPA: biotin transporter BioY [Firmicutes bacterium]|nr:biotin transporter BioY [Candidatus Fermentithermobacillaceae bacterium]
MNRHKNGKTGPPGFRKKDRFGFEENAFYEAEAYSKIERDVLNGQGSLMKTRSLVLAALCAALIGVLAQVAVPVPFSPVPFTGQMLGVFLTGAVLGRKLGVISVLTYVLLGVLGLPVFARGMSGVSVLLGPSGGYLVGFVAGVYVLGFVVERGTEGERGYLRSAAGMLLCLIITYLFGLVQLSLVMNLSFKEALLVGAVPFIPVDVVKALLAARLAVPVRKALRSAGML